MIQFLPLIGTVLEKLLPDPQAQAAAKLKLIELEQAGDLKELDAAVQRDLAQIALNTKEAESPSLFKSGWRPSVGWICVAGLAYSTIVYPLLTWMAVVYNITPPPNLSVEVLMPILLGMLGLGGMRSFEKFKGITK